MTLQSEINALGGPHPQNLGITVTTCVLRKKRSRRAMQSIKNVDTHDMTPSESPSMDHSPV
jgi:hypothetical protein